MDELQLKRKLLFTPAKSKKALHNWINYFLGLDMPDSVVMDFGPNPSNSSPMDLIWEVYDRCLRNDLADASRIIGYAARDSFKSLSSSILEVLCMFHLDRDVGHLAAIESQSLNVQKYVREFLTLPYLSDFKIGDNKETIEIVYYKHKIDGTVLTERELKDSEQSPTNYARTSRYIKVVIATQTAANSLHCLYTTLDEIDLMDEKAYEQAKFIPAPRDGKLPATLLISTRKSGTGLVQKELDNAEKSGLLIRHWNVIDVTEACPKERHRPDLPKLPIYKSEERLQALSEEAYNDLLDEEKASFTKEEGYWGCLNNCKIFSVCQGRLATNQLSKSSLLRPIITTQNRMREASEDTVKAELLCWRPSSEGLIYSKLNPQIHKLSTNEIIFKMTGEMPAEKISKNQLYQYAKYLSLQFYVGMDFGYTHNFAVTMGFKFNNILFITDCWEIPELDDVQKLEFCNRTIKEHDPVIFPDPESPATISLLRKRGFRMKQWRKGKGSVVAGIEAMRSKIMPGNGVPEVFFLKNDPGIDSLFYKLSRYHWKVNKAGEIYDDPDDKDDDSCDSARYLVMNVFPAGGKGKISGATNLLKEPSSTPEGVYTPENWFQKIIQEQTGSPATSDIDKVDENGHVTGKKGGLKWSF